MRTDPVTDLRGIIAAAFPSILAVLVATAVFAKDSLQPAAAGLWERVDSTGAPAAWFGILVPAATPRAIVDTLSRTLNHAMTLPDVRQRLADLGATASPDTPEEFRSFIAAETEKWKGVVEFAGLKLD